ncbi:MAG: ABC transporter substrate-binding protein [Candidatus Korarchaeota archaeon]|nr:ABC transporter substrate-binding protein [Candidatus Korarchaeota archaeon]
MGRRWLALMALLVASLGALAAYQFREARTGGGRGERLVLAWGDWGQPNPFSFYPRGPGYVVTSLIFDTLVWKDEDGLIPWLAESWSVSPNGTVYTFRLREGVRWHDGEPLTARDAAFTFNYLREKGWRWKNVDPSLILGAEAPDDMTLLIRLSRPFPLFLETYASTVFIIPEHVWSRVDDPFTYVEPDSFIGSGPYVLEEYEPGVGYRLRANEHYFAGRPAYAELELKAIADPNTVAAAIRQGQVQSASFWGGQVRLVRQLQEAVQGLRVQEGDTYWVLYLDFNHASWPTNVTEFRRAVAHALNLTEVVERSVGLEAAVVGNPGYLPPYSPWYNPDVPLYDYDPDAALRGLADLGISDVDGDGRLELPSGEDLRLRLVTVAQFVQEARLVAEQLGRIGISVEVRALSDFTQLDEASRSGDYDLMISGHGATGNDPLGFIWYFSRWGAAPWDNGTYRAALSELASSRSVEELARVVDGLQVIVAQNLPQIPLYYPKTYVVSRPEVVVEWFFTHMGIDGGIPLPFNKLALLRG